ncbi:MAG TPA: MMPL family transporter [Acidisphaera sp.]|nr:MMPL family transporter [Acidisphaera sp.]
MLLPNLLAALVGRCRRFAPWVVLGGILLAAGAAWYASGHLGVSTDTDEMFAKSLPWRQHAMAFGRDFPQNSDLLVAVVDGRIPEEAEATAAALADALRADRAHFLTVRRPDSSPYLHREGLLFLSQDKLQKLLDQTIDAQPFLGQLVADPSARGLFAALGLLGLGVQHDQAGDLANYAPELRGFHASMADALAGRPIALSWENLLSGDVAALGPKFKFVLVQPKQDYGSLQPGGAATEAMRAIIANLEFVRSGDAHVRITGQVALADEEFSTVAQGAVWGLLGSFALITLWLFLAVRGRLILPILGTLALGLTFTLFFASVAIGTLNLVSVGFAVLFVGIAVDFSIQFAVRYREMRLAEGSLEAALEETGRRVGIQILVAAMATAAGFLAFVPTSFSGVAELGLIAGFGMLIAFVCTMTFLPAAITLVRPRREKAEVGFTWAAPLDPVIHRRRLPMLCVFGTLAAAGVVLLPFLQFDSDPLHTKNPNTEAMRTLQDLLDDPVSNPYSADILAPSYDAATALMPKLEKLPLAGNVISAASFVPQDQAPKLAAVADANSILAVTLSPPATPPAAVTPADIRMAAKSAEEQIGPALPKLPKDSPLIAIDADLKAVQLASDATLIAMNAALVRFLPTELEQLRTALSATPATVADLPADLRREWMLPDGRTRIQVLAKPGARDSAGLRKFVGQVDGVAPDAAGSAVTIVATADTIVNAFRTAAIGAVFAIAVLLFAVLRRVLDMALVLSALLLSALMTVVVIVALPLPINFANIIALPLLLGVGVSFNIYFVMNWRAGRPKMLGSATARAVTFSACTTGSAFGTLALSAHPGTASMGQLLLISLGCTLLATLAFLPALLSAIGPAATREVAHVDA